MASLEAPLPVARRDDRATTTERYVPAWRLYLLRALHCYKPTLRTPRELQRAIASQDLQQQALSVPARRTWPFSVPAHQNKPPSTSTLINTPQVQHFSALRPTTQHHWSWTSTCPFDVAGAIFSRGILPSHTSFHHRCRIPLKRVCAS
ncbi:hypothetical protein DPSP01_000027 [Paraphaeosphaeria sporulosa]